MKNSHPSYATLSLSRQAPPLGPLFCAHTRQEHSLVLEVREAEVDRDADGDYLCLGKTILSVVLTPAALGEALTSQGAEVPCTIRAREGKEIPPTEYATRQSIAEGVFAQSYGDMLREVKERGEKFSLSLRAHKLTLDKEERERMADDLVDTLRLLERLGPRLMGAFRDGLVDILEEIPSFVQRS